MKQLIAALAFAATSLHGAEHAEITQIYNFLQAKGTERTISIDGRTYNSKGETFWAGNGHIPGSRTDLLADAINFGGIDSIVLERQEITENGTLLGARILDFRDGDGRYGMPDQAWLRDSSNPDWIKMDIKDAATRQIMFGVYDSIGNSIYDYIIRLATR